MSALSKAIAKGYKATHDGVTKLYRKVTGKFGMTSNELIASGDDVGRVAGIVINSDEFAETLAKYSNGTLIKKFPNLSNAEEAIIRYYTGGSHEILNQALVKDDVSISPVITLPQIIECQKVVRQIYVDEKLKSYIFSI
mgnify:CR=1 FL=1